MEETPATNIIKFPKDPSAEVAELSTELLENCVKKLGRPIEYQLMSLKFSNDIEALAIIPYSADGVHVKLVAYGIGEKRIFNSGDRIDMVGPKWS